MKDYVAIEKDIESAREITGCLLNEENTNTVELQRIFEDWKVNEKVNKFEAALEKFEEKCKLIKEKIERKLIKLYFFGRMSSGKSTIINGIIRKDLFLVRPEHTTNCFVHIEKSENIDYTIIVDGNVSRYHDFAEARDEIENLSTDSEGNDFDKDKFIRVFVPIEEDNKIMKENIELIDTPGSGNREQITKCITEYAKDADIFVFVLMHDITEEDKNFFEFQTENSTKPDIFVLINKWNDTDSNRPDKIKQSKHNLKVKCEKLIMKMSENSSKDHRERTYFIAANELCDIRINNKIEYLSDEKKKERFENFEMFESKLSQYIQNPKKNKCQRYSLELQCLSEDISKELKKFGEDISSTLSYSIKIMKENNRKCEEYVKKIKEKCKKAESKSIENIECKVTTMMNTINIDNSDEIKENIRNHFLSIDEDIIKLFTDLDEKLSVIKENYVKENNNHNKVKNDNISFSKLGDKDFQIKTDMNFITFPKSKVAIRVLSFLPFIGGLATNILLGRIDNADEHHLNKKSLNELEKEIHEKDKERDQFVKENIKKIENHFIEEINEIKNKINLKITRLETVKGKFF